jgi:hypothetical protein
MLVAYFPREINFLVAAVVSSLHCQSTKNKFLNVFLKALNFIPTRRPQDEAKKGVGSIVSLDKEHLKAVGTKFAKTVGEKYTISLNNPKCNLLVKRVIDDENLLVDNIDLSLTNGNEDYTITPKLDQKDVFDSSWKLLGANQVVGIFPEVCRDNIREGRMTRRRSSRSRQGLPSFTWER